MGKLPRWVRAGLLALLSVLDLMAIAVWFFRLSPIYDEWLKLPGPRAESPGNRTEMWLTGRLAPWTPAGYLSLFEPVELFFPAALLFGLAVLLTLLAITCWGQSLPLLARVQAGMTWPPPLRLRVTTALIAVAVVGLELGWEVNAWETWRLRSRYLALAYQYYENEYRYRESAKQNRYAIAQFDGTSLIPSNDVLTEEALAAERARLLDRWKRELAYCEMMADASAQLRKKYEVALTRLRAPVAPDEPLPDREPDGQELLARREYRRALKATDEEIRRFPGLWDAHNRRARILATCPDPALRDGKAALASAHRACELTNWRLEAVLDTLAAAWAERGNFKAAVEWQTKVLAAIDKRNLVAKREAQKRLAIYRSRRPYHEIE